MLWVLLSVLAAFLWSLVAVIDKHAITDELRDPALATSISGVVMFAVFALISVFFGVETAPDVILFATLAGIFFNIAIFFYYKAMQHEEASRVIPILMTTPVFVLVFASVFLRESFSPVQYLGIFFLVIGAILITLKRNEKGFSAFRKKSKVFLSAVAGVAFLSTLAYAVRNILTEYAIRGVGPFSIFLWMGIGTLITSVVIFSLHRPKISKKARKGIKHVKLSKLLSAAAMFILTIAISQNTVSLPSALASIEALFVFVIAVLLSKHRPKIIREELKGSALFLKFIAIVIIILGSFMIV
jgi:transporter family protein